MAKTFDRQTVNGQEYFVMDAKARGDVSELESATNEQLNGTNGAFYGLRSSAIGSDGTWGSSDTAKHIVIRIAPGQTFQIKANGQRASIFAILTSDEVLVGRMASFSSAEGFTERIVCNAGETSELYTAPQDAKYLYITAIASSTINYFPESIVIDGIERNDNVRLHIAEIENEIEATNERIDIITPNRIELKVCTFNLGMYNYGRDTTSHERKYTSEKVEALKEFISSGDFDILACQEATDLDDQNFLGYFTQITKRNLLNISTKISMTDIEYGEFVAKYNNEPRYWLKSKITVNGIEITLFNCHLSWQEEAASVRAQQHQEIIGMLSDSSYALVFGDFNAYSISEFDDFVSAGLKIANGGYLTAKDTAPALEPEYPMDNFLIKGPNLLRIKATRSIGQIIEITPEEVDPEEDEFDRYLTDHLPVSGKAIIRY